ncbi:11 kDA orf [Sugarcane streak virus - [Natal]]|uniref:Movement protein n=1 Tax=Sugarcane streak virus (isolate South Africa) TaxID=268781 RepID=MP_SSVN|nr:movement protein [Sugarcane streak virus]Q89448.1 RecName: Full=Movement protein; Short=MP [Sugarcane streak virus - [Natal]]AAA47828.1 11 kDA orf [Sugarcane streak virus - [Natal]]AAP13954.1 11.16 kda orf(V1) [Sugarcane streak virus - [Natal]]
MDSFGRAPPLWPQSALPRVPGAAPSSSGLPWSRVGEIAIFTFVAVLALYLLWSWVGRDLLLVLKARRGGTTEELTFGPRERHSLPAVAVARVENPPCPSGSVEARPFTG